jgi:DNA helicase IV
VSSWDDVLDEAGVSDHVVRELRISYRVPSDFLVLAGALLPEGAPAPRGVRDAPVPAVAIETDDVGASAARIAGRFAEEVGSVGVCVPHAHMEAVRARLREFVDATDGSPLGPGVNLIDLHVAKGLEFDAIVVVEPAAILRERPDGGVGGLYTALTRSTRALAIVHSEPLPDALSGTTVLRTETDSNSG